MQLGRQRMFYNEGRNLRTWHRILFISAAIVVILSFLDFGILEVWLKSIYNLVILLMIVSAVVSAWYAFDGVRRITYAVMVGCGMVVCQYLFAYYWFSNHQRGPLEGLWRKLTWIRYN